MAPRHYLYLAVVALALLLILLLSGKCRGEEGRKDTAEQIVAAVLKAYGGEKPLEKIRSVTAKGRIVDFINGMEGAYARYFERPGRLRVEIMPDQGGEVRILDGGRGWQAGPKGFTVASPAMRQSMVYQYSYLDLPMGLADRTYPVSYGGKQRIGNRETHLLLINLRGAPQLRVFIDAETSLIVRVAADFAMGMMGSSELATEYHDFRPVGGVLFPHRLVNYAGDTRLSEIVLSEIQVNREIPASLFTPVQSSDTLPNSAPASMH